MEISDAKNKAFRLRVYSIVIYVIVIAFFCTSAVKSLYYGTLYDYGVFGHLIGSLNTFMELIYGKVFFISWLWELAPRVSVSPLNTVGNVCFILIVAFFSLAREIWKSANELSKRIKNTYAQLEESGWRNTLGHTKANAGSAEILTVNINVDNIDQWYKRPLGVVLLAVTGGDSTNHNSFGF